MFTIVHRGVRDLSSPQPKGAITFSVRVESRVGVLGNLLDALA
jgi:hypothetical protein